MMKHFRKHLSRLFVPLSVILATTCALPATAQAYSATYDPVRVMYAAKRSNVRAGPGTSYERVGLLEVAEQVRVTAKRESWFKLEPKADQQERFVYAPLLSSIRPEATSVGEGEAAASGGLVTRTVTYSDGGRYHGQTRNGRRHGHGVYTWTQGNRYEGEWRDGRRHGHGTLTWKGTGKYAGREGRYEGEWRNSKQHGRGVITWPEGSRYQGDFRDGKRSGHGVYTSANGSRYEGPWKEDEPNEVASSARVARAKQCVERLGGGTYRNRCNQMVAFHYCYKETDGYIPTCGKPSVRERHGHPNHYYTHLHYAEPGKAFQVPFAEYRYRWAVCPSRGESTFYHAVSARPGKYKCQFVLFATTRRKADAARQLARAHAAEERRAREEAAWQREEEAWEREQEQLAAERRRENAEAWNRVGQSLRNTLRILRRDQRRSPTGGREPSCRSPELACADPDDPDCRRWASLPLCR